MVDQKGDCMLLLTPSASRASWQAAPRHGDKKWDETLHKAISNKFNHTCQYCGWVDDEFNEVDHINEDHTNNREENLTLACPLCHQIKHLGQVGTSDGGKMIWAPELSQVELNHLARAYWMLETDQSNDLLISARTLSNKLEHQAHVLEAHYVNGASDPGFWAEALIKMTPEQYKNRAEILKNIRVWPNLIKFKRMVPKWANDVGVNLPIKEWTRIELPRNIAGE
jgi:intracellular multiplication protein IcmJ